jgi:hypothetical protein
MATVFGWLLLGIALGIEVTLDARGQSSLARQHHHFGARPAATEDRPVSPTLSDLDAEIYETNPQWVGKYESLQRAALDLSFLHSEALRVGQQYHARADRPEDDRTRALYDKYADLRDELRTKRRSVKRSASDLMEQIRPESRAESVVLDHVGSFVERLGGVHNVALLQEAAPGQENTPIVDDRMETSTMAEGELVEARAKLMESHSEDMTDQLQKYQGMVCPEHSTCGGCENDNGAPVSDNHCRNPKTNECFPWQKDGKPRSCPEGAVPCDSPQLSGDKPEMKTVKEHVRITIQGWGFSVSDDPMEDSCLMGVLLPKVRLVENLGTEGKNNVASACMSRAALERNMELQLARCVLGQQDDDAAADGETLDSRKCILAHLNKPIIKAPRNGGYKGTNSAQFLLEAGNVRQPVDTDVHYIMCLLQGRTVERAETGAVFVAEDICIRKTQAGDDGEEEFVECGGKAVEGAGPGSGAARTAALLLALTQLL